jgi:hypothetical protein
MIETFLAYLERAGRVRSCAARELSAQNVHSGRTLASSKTCRTDARRSNPRSQSGGQAADEACRRGPFCGSYGLVIEAVSENPGEGAAVSKHGVARVGTWASRLRPTGPGSLIILAPAGIRMLPPLSFPRSGRAS